MHNIYNIYDNLLLINKNELKSTTISQLFHNFRLDAGIHSEEVQNFLTVLKLTLVVFHHLKIWDIRLKRGPSLQKRDIGRSIISRRYIPNYPILVYPK